MNKIPNDSCWIRQDEGNSMYFSSRLLLLLLTGLGAGCAALPNRMIALAPVPTHPMQSLEGTCLKVEVVDGRDDKSIYLMGAFNVLRTQGEGHIEFIRSEFETSATARGAKNSSLCQFASVPTAIRVTINDLVFDSAWAWPLTAHQSRVALGVVAEKGPETIRRELELRRAMRVTCPTDKPRDPFQVWGVPCLSTQVRELAASFYDDPQVQGFLKPEQ